jgi:glutamate racemase
MATTGPLRSEQFRLLAQAHAAHVELVLQPCPGLAAAIEGGDAESTEVVTRVREYCSALVQAEVDTVVLGCTHYPFVAHHIQATLGPSVQLVDTAQAVARRTAAVSPAQLWSTGAAETLRSFAQRWLDFPFEIAAGSPD